MAESMHTTMLPEVHHLPPSNHAASALEPRVDHLHLVGFGVVSQTCTFAA